MKGIGPVLIVSTALQHHCQFCTRTVEILCVCIYVHVCVCVCVKVLKEELKFIHFPIKINETATILKTQTILLWSLKFILKYHHK